MKQNAPSESFRTIYYQFTNVRYQELTARNNRNAEQHSMKKKAFSKTVNLNYETNLSVSHIMKREYAINND